MTTAFYRNGTVAVTQNSKVVTGTNTNWATGATKPLAGDVFVFNNKIYEIENVISNTEIRLFRNFEDATASNQAYMIMRNASLNISSRIAAQVAQVVNQKQIMLDEFENFLTNNKDALVYFTDTLGNKVPVTPIPMLDASHNQAIADLNKKADDVISSQILMSEAEAMAQADAYENIFDASGMVHMGKQFVGGEAGVINEGMWIYPDVNYPNTVWMGRENANGTSETDYPVTYIAGAISNVLGTGFASQQSRNLFHLPPAEPGTRVHDSTGDVRGSGKATLDFRFDQDPKYGDVPTGTESEILREAVGRAFEGSVKNGDFRNGTAEWGTYAQVTHAVVDGRYVITGTGNGGGGYYNATVIPNEEVTIEVAGLDASISGINARVIFYDGPNFSSQLLSLNAQGADSRITAKLTPTQNIIRVYVYVSGVGETIGVDSISISPITEEVVTHRSDLATWESYDEELTGRKEVMECIQSLSTTFGDTDVPTVLSTRPNSYFDQYDGQSADPDAQNTKYRCVVWDDLTDEQKRKVAAYMGNKLYVGENGKLVNRRLRARTFRGLGNGDWRNINATHKGTSWDQFLSFTTSHGGVRPQGSSDSSQAYSNTSGDTYATTPLQETNNDVAHKGAFAVWSLTNQAYKGRCYLYVVASVPRANMGGYCKGLNEFGTRQFTLPTVKDGNWYDFPDYIKTLQDCFIQADYDANTFGARPASGSIGRVSGHPDGISYDGITAGGLNGVIDWRLPAVANDSPEEQAKVQGKVENKTFRGLQKLAVCGTKVTLPDVRGDGTKYIPRPRKDECF